ncbi:MAG: hypothetical protein ACOZCO_07780, partial [Bacteroidota bacterium]
MKKRLLFIVFILCLMMYSYEAKTQNVGINATGATPNTSAGLDVDFTNKGMLVPRVALTSVTDAITIATPATSLLVYNTATAGTAPNNVTPGFYYWGGTSWIRIANGNNNDWSTTGNTGTTPGANFIGTTDNKDLVFKTNNDEQMRIDANGKIGVNTSAPANLLHIADGAGDVLIDRGVAINSRMNSMDPEFNIINYGETTPDYIEIGDHTEQVRKMQMLVPLANPFTSDDGAVEVIVNSGFPMNPLMHFNETQRIGVNTNTPANLLHIADGAGDVLIDKGVAINSRMNSMDPEFNIINYGETTPDYIEIGDHTEQVRKMQMLVPLANPFTSDD